jgi:heavy metal sensor kinase
VKIPNRLRSIRSILTLWYSAVLLLGFALFGGAVYTYLDYRGHEALEEGVTSEVDWIANLMSVGLQPGEALDSLMELPPETRRRIENHLALQAENYAIMLKTPDGRLLYSAGDRTATDVMQAPSVSGRTVLASIQRGPDDDLTVASVSHETFELHVAVPEERIRDVLRHTIALMVLMAPVCLLLSVGGGWFLSGVGLRPVGAIIDIANRRTLHNLNERIPERDVDDELGRLIKTLNHTADRMEASVEQVKRFSSDVAHELKTPLTILRGEAELALGGATTPEEAQRLATTFLEESVRLSRIVEDLLTLAQADAGRAHLERKPVRIEELVEDLYDDAVILAAEKKLKIELSENSPATVLGDAARLRRLLRSLISNAVRYTDPGGTIRIHSRPDGVYARISVRDTGIGIPAGSLEKIFDRFYRVDEARSRDRGGSGLGLSLSKWIAESHGGAIAVASEVGMGTTFTVTLPLEGESGT